MASEVSICNRALRLLRVQPISSLDEDGEAAGWCAETYGDARDALIAEYPWNFATRRAALPALAEAPTWGFARAFQLPGDPERCLRVLRLEGEPEEEVLPYQVEGRRIVSDEAAPLRILYLARVVDPTSFPPLFVEALAARLAAEGAFHFTGSTSREAQLNELYDRKLALARRFDAQEGTAPGIVADEWLRSRL